MGNLTVNVAGLTKLGCKVVGHHRIPQELLGTPVFEQRKTGSGSG
jgi:hypothetical protein